MDEMISPLCIACVQMDVVHGDIDKNLAKATAMIRTAADHGAELIVLPETFSTDCNFSSRAEVFSLSEPVPDGKTTKALMALAKEKNIYITGSMVENDRGKLYNTAILVGPEGFIGKYRKLHLCEEEVFWFEPGDLGIPVFYTPFGRIALLICLDGYYPETYRICALQKADIVCIPTNWMQPPQLTGGIRTMGPTLTMANALSNYMFVAACNRVGESDGQVFPGQSLLANQWGVPLAGPAGDQEEIIYATVDVIDTRIRYINATNSRLGNRRTDIYDEWLGYRR